MQPLNWTNILQVFPFVNLHPMILEHMVFRLAERYGRNYNGGQWYVDDSKGYPVLVAPTITGYYEVVNGENYFEGTMNEETFGAVLTVLALNRLTYSPDCRDVEALGGHWSSVHEKMLESLDGEALSDYIGFLD